MRRIFILTASLVLYIYSGANAASLYDTVQKGNKLYTSGKFDEALKTYVDGQIEHADDPNLKYNIASAHYKNKNYEEAIKGYLDVAATAKDVKLQEKSLYGSGNALFRQGKLEEAIEYYKKALEIDPNDQDAKHNLEFAREELKRRINEAKETEKKQQEQKQQEQNQQKEQQNNQGEQQDQNKQPEEKPAQSQQQEQKKEEQQGASQQEQKQEEQKGQPQQEQDKQQAKTGEQKPEEQPKAQAQLGSIENKQDGKAEEGQAVPQKARQMTKEEADQWLNSIEENRDKFAKKKARESVSGQYRPEKDW